MEDQDKDGLELVKTVMESLLQLRMTVLQARDGLTMSRWIETVHWPVLSLRPGAGAFTLLRVLPPLLALVTACELVFAAQ